MFQKFPSEPPKTCVWGHSVHLTLFPVTEVNGSQRESEQGQEFKPKPNLASHQLSLYRGSNLASSPNTQSLCIEINAHWSRGPKAARIPNLSEVKELIKMCSSSIHENENLCVVFKYFWYDKMAMVHGSYAPGEQLSRMSTRGAQVKVWNRNKSWLDPPLSLLSAVFLMGSKNSLVLKGTLAVKTRRSGYCFYGTDRTQNWFR